MKIQEHDKTELTVLYRADKGWSAREIAALMGLCEAVSVNDAFPKYLILRGNHTKEAVVKAVGEGVAFGVIHATGKDSKLLPFEPQFI